ncbi:MAG: PEGA domain-containing protein [Candidatus Gottesmanbacteria bacterium]
MYKKIIFIIIGVILLAGGIFLGIQSFSSQGPARLKVTSTPVSTIFLDTQHLGKTPYEKEVTSGEYTLKLIPDDGIYPSWETKIKITSGVLTFINHDFNTQELTSAGEILTLEKITGQKAEIAVISTPESAAVSLDGISRGNTPLMLADIEPGDHEISVSASGFISRGIKVKTTPGYKLVVSFQLALSTASPSASPLPEVSPSGSPKATPKASPSPSPKVSPKASPKPTVSPSAELARPYITVLDTPTGFLRVRIEPSTSATEAAQIKPGESYPLLDQQNGWYKIKYSGNETGWISGQYAEKYE